MSQESLKEKTKKGFFWKSLESFLQYGLQFVVGIVMARILTPEDYGIAAMPLVFMAIVGTIQDSGFCNALIRKPELTEEDLSTAYFYNISVGIVLYIILYSLSPFIADFYSVPILSSLLRFTALGFLWGPLNIVQLIILNRRLDFKTTMRISLTTRVFSAIVGISLAYMGFGMWSLVINNFLAGILAVILSWITVRWIPKTGWSKESFKYLWGFGNKLLISSLIDRIYSNITPIIVGKFYSPKDLGVYNRAYGYANLPVSQIFTVLNSVTFPVLSQIQSDDEKLANSYRRIIRDAAFIVFPIMFILSALARPLVITMITDKWDACIPMLQLMCFWTMWYPICHLNLGLLQVKGRSDLYLKVETINKIIGVIIISISLPFGLISFICGSILHTLISFSINTYYTGKLINVGFFTQMKDIIPFIFMSLGLFAIIHFLNQIVDNYLIQIFLGGIISLALYLSMAFLLKLPELDDVKYILLKRKK